MAPVPSVTKTTLDSASSDDTIFGLPKWAWAAAAGGVVTVGVLYYLMKPSPGSGKKKSEKKKGKKGADSKASSSSKKNQSGESVKIEDIGEDDVELIVDPATRAVSLKNKGNKYFKAGRYELAIKCYSEAIDLGLHGSEADLATFYQNRAAAYEQLANYASVVSDCSMALKHNPRYVKALERRARITRKQTEDLTDMTDKVSKLKTALEDMTAVCILEGFSKQENLLLVDKIIKELGRAEAKVSFESRDLVMASKHFIKQYLDSFEMDPVAKAASEFVPEEGKELTGFDRALMCLRNENYNDIIDACNEELSDNAGDQIVNGTSSDDWKKSGARLLRATIYILCKKQKLALQDLNIIVDNETLPSSIRSNALIKRAALHIQQCQDPEKDSQLSFKDFDEAVSVDPNNSDVFFHRGQVYLLTEQIEKAVEDFNRSVELNPSFATAYVQKLYTDYRQAMQQNSSDQVDKVMKLFEQALETYPNCVETYALFAQVLSDQQKFEEADRMYERAMKVDPSNANILVHRGLVQLQWQGDVKKATDYLEKAIELDSKCEFAYETLGTLEVQRGSLKRAIELFDQAIPLTNTELEMAHLYGLRNAANAQIVITEKYGLQLPRGM